MQNKTALLNYNRLRKIQVLYQSDLIFLNVCITHAICLRKNFCLYLTLYFYQLLLTIVNYYSYI